MLGAHQAAAPEPANRTDAAGVSDNFATPDYSRYGPGAWCAGAWLPSDHDLSLDAGNDQLAGHPFLGVTWDGAQVVVNAGGSGGEGQRAGVHPRGRRVAKEPQRRSGKTPVWPSSSASTTKGPGWLAVMTRPCAVSGSALTTWTVTRAPVGTTTRGSVRPAMRKVSSGPPTGLATAVRASRGMLVTFGGTDGPAPYPCAGGSL